MPHAVLAKGILMIAVACGHQPQMHIEVSPTLPHAYHLHRRTGQQGSIMISHPIHHHIERRNRIWRVGVNGSNTVQLESCVAVVGVCCQTAERGVLLFRFHLLSSDIVGGAIVQTDTHHPSIGIDRRHQQVGDDGRVVVVIVIGTCSHKQHEHHTQDVSQQPFHNCVTGWHTLPLSSRGGRAHRGAPHPPS